MTKKQIIKKVAERTNNSQEQSKEIIEGLFEEFKEILKDKKNITINGFFSFTVIEIEEYSGEINRKDFKTGKIVKTKYVVPKQNKVNVKVSNKLLEYLNE